MTFSDTCTCYLAFNIDKISAVAIQKMTDDLNTIEKQKLNSMKRPSKRLQFIVAHSNLKILASTEIGAHATLSYSETGQPLFDGTDYHCSISHSANAIMVGVSRSKVGIDLEQVKPRDVSRLKRYLEERLPSTFTQQTETLNNTYLHWTRYEALVKLYGGQIPMGSQSSISDDNFHCGEHANFVYSIAQQQTVQAKITIHEYR